MKNKINDLLAEISLETRFLSFAIEDHPKLLEIIVLGEDAVPILLDHLRESRDAELAKYKGYNIDDYAPWYAFSALRQITNEHPIKPENAGRLFGIIEDWLRWDKIRKGDFVGHSPPCKDGSEY